MDILIIYELNTFLLRYKKKKLKAKVKTKVKITIKIDLGRETCMIIGTKKWVNQSY